MSNKVLENNLELDKNWGFLRAKGFRRIYIKSGAYVLRRDMIISKKGKEWVAEEVDEDGLVGKVKAKSAILYTLIKNII